MPASAEDAVLKAGAVSLDGTKMKASASLAANRTVEGLEQEIAAIVSEAAARGWPMWGIAATRT